MDMGLAGKRALITGGSKGIGLAAAKGLAEEGVLPIIVSRTAADLERAVQSIKQATGVDADFRAVDLSNGDAARSLVAEFSDIDILVNNAGAIPPGTVEEVEEPRWREAWDLKVFGYQNTCRAMLGHMREKGRGVIINVIGAAGEAPTPGYIAGSAGNASIMALTRALGATSREYGVRVVGINPGLIATDRMVTLMKTKAQAKFGDESRWRELQDQVYPPGMPEHVGDMVAFLASDRSANTTGTIITIDGGSSARGPAL